MVVHLSNSILYTLYTMNCTCVYTVVQCNAALQWTEQQCTDYAHYFEVACICDPFQEYAGQREDTNMWKNQILGLPILSFLSPELAI